MHDPKFEKEVQQKMEELVFTPPASVWLNVEKEVNKEKKRRFLPFWLFFLPGTLLVGAGAIYFSGSKHKGQPAPAVNVSSVRPGANQDPSQPVASNPVGSQPAGAGASQPVATHTQSPVKFQPEPNKSLTASRPVSASLPRADRTIPAGDPGTEVIHSSKPVRSSLIAAHHPGRQGAGPATPGQHPTADAIPATPQQTKPNENASIGSDQYADRTGNPGPGGQPFIHRSISPQRSAIDRHAAAITASALSSQARNPVAGKTRLPEPRRPWEAGFAGGVGISSLNQGLLDKSTVTSAAYTNYASAVTGVPQTYVSNAQPDLSFWAGVLLQKGLRKDLSFSLGLNLHYYSSRIKTGKMVNNDLNGQSSSVTPPNNQSGSFVLGNTGLAAAGRAYPYYSPGNNESFTNRYYFLELPASISWQVGHSKTMPLFWEGGLSLSYLVSSNSLYYDPKSGVFYKDGSVINRTQGSVFTGLMAGLPLRGLRIQAGPQVQYGFTNLLNSQGAGGQHLLYGGIKLVFLPGKWKK